MPEGRCNVCGRLIYDTEKLDELPDKLECQHCHFINIIRAKPEPKPIIPIEPIEEKVIPVKRKRR